MILSYLDFNYDLGKMRFEEMNYALSISEQKDKDKIVSKMKDCFKDLEGILDVEFLDNEFKKEKIGTIRPNNGSLGYKYSSKDICLGYTTLKYNFKTKNNKISDAEITIVHIDQSQEGILKVYDKILALSWIEFSKDSQKASDKIEKLREGVKEEDYLSLLTT